MKMLLSSSICTLLHLLLLGFLGGPVESRTLHVDGCSANVHLHELHNYFADIKSDVVSLIHTNTLLHQWRCSFKVTHRHRKAFHSCSASVVTRAGGNKVPERDFNAQFSDPTWQISADGEIGVKLMDTSLIRNVQVSSFFSTVYINLSALTLTILNAVFYSQLKMINSCITYTCLSPSGWSDVLLHASPAAFLRWKSFQQLQVL